SVKSVKLEDLDFEVAPPAGSKVFRVEFIDDTAGITNLGKRDQNQLVVTNPKAKGTVAEDGEDARVRITFSKNAFLRSDAKFQVGFNGEVGSTIIGKSIAQNELQLFTEIQKVLVKGGIPEDLVPRTPNQQGNSMTLKRVETTDGS